MNRNRKITEVIIKKLVEHFVAGTPARSSTILCGVSRETANKWYQKFRKVITKKLNQDRIIFDGEVELDESYFGGRRKGKQGRGPGAKTIGGWTL